MTCDGGTCYAGCTCSESAWAEKLAVAEERIRELGSIGNAREAEVAAHMEARYAAEERARGMGEALREIGKHECRHAKLGDGIDCTRVGMVFPDGFTACPSCIARAALAPPPEAASSCENFNANLRAAVAAAPPVTGYTVVNERGEERHVEFPPPEAEKRGEGA